MKNLLSLLAFLVMNSVQAKELNEFSEKEFRTWSKVEQELLWECYEQLRRAETDWTTKQIADFYDVPEELVNGQLRAAYYDLNSSVCQRKKMNELFEKFKRRQCLSAISYAHQVKVEKSEIKKNKKPLL